MKRLIPEAVEPAAKRCDASRVDRVQPSRALGPHHDEPGFLEHLQVLGHRGTADIHPVGNLPHRTAAMAEAVEHTPARGVPQGIEGPLCVRHHGRSPLDFGSAASVLLAPSRPMVSVY
jgi:hypothetical protein